MTDESDEAGTVGAAMQPGPPPRAEQVVFPLRQAAIWAVMVELLIIVAVLIDVSGWLG